MAKLSPQQPVNLVSGYLKQKRRQRILRRGLIAACWLGLGGVLLNFWTGAQAWRAEQGRLDELSAREPAMTAERDRLMERNRLVEREQIFIRQAEEERLPPVAGKFLAYLAGLLPAEIRLTDLTVKWEGAPTGGWSFRIEGAVEADEETAREIISALQKQLGKSPLRARFNATAQAVVAMSVNAGPRAAEVQRFSLEGVMLEN